MTTSVVPRARSVGRRASPPANECHPPPSPAGRRPGPTRPGRPDPRTGHDPHPGAGPGAPRPDERLALRLLPRWGAGDGGGRRAAAAQRHQRPGVRRRPPRQLRPVRLTRARPAVRHQRLRRDPDRRLGMGPDAPVGEPRRWPPDRDRSRTTRLAMPSSRPCAPTASGWPSTRACAPSTSTTRASTAARSWSSRTSGPGRTCSRPSTRPRITTRSTSCQDHHAHGRQAADHRPPADHHAPRRDEPRASSRPRSPATARASRRTDASCSTATSSWTPRSRSWVSAASAWAPSWRSSRVARTLDPLFLQAKVAEASVFERFTHPSPFATHGERVVAGQRRLQAASDVLLGWARGSARPPPVRAAAPGPEGVRRRRGDGPRRPRDLGSPVRLGAGPRPCPLRRPVHARRLPGRRRCHRPRDGGLRRPLRRPDRAGPRGVRRRHQTGPRGSRVGQLRGCEPAAAPRHGACAKPERGVAGG